MCTGPGVPHQGKQVQAHLECCATSSGQADWPADLGGDGDIRGLSTGGEEEEESGGYSSDNFRNKLDMKKFGEMMLSLISLFWQMWTRRRIQCTQMYLNVKKTGIRKK